MTPTFDLCLQTVRVIQQMAKVRAQLRFTRHMSDIRPTAVDSSRDAIAAGLGHRDRQAPRRRQAAQAKYRLIACAAGVTCCSGAAHRRPHHLPHRHRHARCHAGHVMRCMTATGKLADVCRQPPAKRPFDPSRIKGWVQWMDGGRDSGRCWCWTRRTTCWKTTTGTSCCWWAGAPVRCVLR